MKPQTSQKRKTGFFASMGEKTKSIRREKLSQPDTALHRAQDTAAARRDEALSGMERAGSRSRRALTAVGGWCRAHLSMQLLPGGKSRGMLFVDLFLAALVVLCCGFFAVQAIQGDTAREVTITDSGRSVTYLTKTATVNECLQANGYKLEENDALSVYEGTPVEEAGHIRISRSFPVLVRSAGETRVLHLLDGTVGDALRQAHVAWDSNDELSYPQFAQVTPCMYISHANITEEYRTEYRDIEYRTITKRDSSLDENVKKKVTDGVKGEKRLILRTIYRDGEKVGTEVADQVILKEKVDDVTIVGTRKIRYQTSLKNDSRRWKEAPKEKEIAKTLRCEVTAYTHTGRRTATGTWPKVGTVAVDPKVIPYGTKLYIPGYGYCVARDCGGFTGNKIDVFMDTRSECTRWGHKYNVKVYVLK